MWIRLHLLKFLIAVISPVLYCNVWNFKQNGNFKIFYQHLGILKLTGINVQNRSYLIQNHNQSFS